MIETLQQLSQPIADVCRRYGVKRLDVVGSAARGTDFDPSSSDYDFVVRFSPQSVHQPLEEYFGLRAALADLLHRDVDLIEENAIRNPYLRATLDQSRQTIYAA